MGLSFYLSLLPLGYNIKGIRWNGLEPVKRLLGTCSYMEFHEYPAVLPLQGFCP